MNKKQMKKMQDECNQFDLELHMSIYYEALEDVNDLLLSLTGDIEVWPKAEKIRATQALLRQIIDIIYGKNTEQSDVN